MVPRTDLIDNVEETVVVHVVYRVVGAEDAQLLLHAVADKGFTERDPELPHHRNELVDLHSTYDLDVVEGVLNPVLGDGDQGRQGVSLGSDLNLPHVCYKGSHVVHARVCNVLEQGSVLIVDANIPLLDPVQGAEDNRGDNCDQNYQYPGAHPQHILVICHFPAV